MERSIWTGYAKTNQNNMTPLELVESERDKFTKALRKSAESYKNGQIDYNLHEAHVMNLAPQIKEWNEAVAILKKGLE
jgi:hypothetical protein